MPRITTRAVIVAVVLASFVAGVQPALPDASADPVAGGCRHAGTVRPTPGLSSEAKDFTFRFRGTVGPCLMSDGSIRKGTEYGAGRANGDCALRTATARWTIVWDSGKRTVIDASFGGVLNVINTSGPVVKGEFVGAMFEDGHLLSGFDPASCLSPTGVTKAAYQGAFSIVPQG